MIPANHICYRAVKSRDARFDGRFFTAVKTTGIYCRPVCPARTPKRENMQFFACAAAAEDAGYRPCLRCRPETSPGTPAWSGTSATVSRALRLIDVGALDEAGIESLAGRLGVSPRHLRRLFDEHLGASPITVAQSRRVWMAKKLLEQTTLPVTEIAFASGFASVRRFNAAFAKVFHQSPREVRGARGKRVAKPASDAIEIRLAYRPPLDARSLLSFLELRALPGVETVADGVYRRTVRMGDAMGRVAVRVDEKRNDIVVRASLGLARRLPDVVSRVRRVFDLGADPEMVDAHLNEDTTLRQLLKRRPGLRVPGAWDPFELAVRAIIGQQISVAGARTVCSRLVMKYGDPIDEDSGEGLERLFPTPERLARARMNEIGLTGRRIATLRSLAREVASGEIALATGSSLEEFTNRLCTLPGIGPWTAHYIAMRALGEPDAFPSADLGLLKAWAQVSGREASARALQERAEGWRPWRAYAAMHLWTHLGGGG